MKGLKLKIALINRKGGVARTTAAVYLAEAFSRRGYRTSVWDLTPLGDAVEWVERAPLGKKPLWKLVHCPDGHIDQVEKEDDVCILDLPSHEEELNRKIAGEADLVIMPTFPYPHEIKEVRFQMEDLSVTDKSRILFSIVDTRTKTSRLSDERLLGAVAANRLPRPFQTRIPTRTGIARAYTEGMSALHGYDNVVEEILEWRREIEKRNNATAFSLDYPTSKEEK